MTNWTLENLEEQMSSRSPEIRQFVAEIKEPLPDICCEILSSMNTLGLNMFALDSMNLYRQTFLTEVSPR